MAKIIDLDKVRAGATGDITPGEGPAIPGVPVDPGPTGTDAACLLVDYVCDPGAYDGPCNIDWACGGYGGYDAGCVIDHVCGHNTY